MLYLKIYSDIETAEDQMFYDAFGLNHQVVCFDSIQKLLEDNPDETEITLKINCNGGYVSEGLAIYDLLRTSGKKIYSVIEGKCHSMAIVLLLAAPKENRSGKPNATALIHDVSQFVGCVSAQESVEIAADLIEVRNKILDIYADRTGTDRALLENIMLEEKERSMKDLKEWGFISTIIQYNTNLKKAKMAKRFTKWGQLVNTISNLGKVSNWDFTDEEGNVLFTTPREDDVLEVNEPASPDGTFELPDGKIVEISEGIIVRVENPDSGSDGETTDRIEALEATVNTLVSAVNGIVQMMNISSDAEIPSRIDSKPASSNKGKKPAGDGTSSEERKANIAAARKAGTGRGSNE